MNPELARYLALEMKLSIESDEAAADALMDEMDPLWRALPQSDRDALNERKE
jgi:hypothetical protein